MKNEFEEYDSQLRRYLLGELTFDEQQLIEEQLLTDENYMEQMLIVEEDLIDDYAAGKLSPQQQANYQKLFLASPEGRQKLKVSRILKQHLNDFPTKTTHQSTFWERVQLGLAQLLSPSILKAAAAMLVLGFGVFSWWAFLRSDLSTAMTALKNAYSEQRPLEFRMTSFPYARFSPSTHAQSQTVVAKLKAADKAFHNLLDDKQTSESLHELGKYNLAKMNFQEAVAILDKGLSLAPDQTSIKIDLAVALIERGKLRLLDAAQAENAQADFDKGRKHLEQAIASSPSSFEAHFNLALLHQTMKSWPEAEKAWKQFLAMDEKSEWSQEARRYLELSIEAQKQ
ncbi:MAG: hypothetical protein SF097_25055 [Acidobacteriota bacterium]|nr:hypothetical protein [Acidobacteriota bacterium]